MAHPKRLKGHDYRGRQYLFITACTPDQRETFREEIVCEYVIAQLLRCANEDCVEVTAYCVMPDHVHVLLLGTSDSSDLTRAVARWKQFSGFWFGHRKDGRLWEPGFWDRVLRGDDDPAAFVHYIVMNPVAADLVTSPELYRWIGSSVFGRDELIKATLDFEAGRPSEGQPFRAGVNAHRLP